MVKLAVLDDVLPAQIRERPSELEGVQLAWDGTTLDDLFRILATLRPDVVVADLDRLGNDPNAQMREIQERSGASLVIAMYRFARRDAVEGIAGEGRKVVRAPVTLGGLRSHFMGLIVRNILNRDEAPVSTRAPQFTSVKPAPRPSIATGSVPARKFSPAQLGRLAEIQSSIQCECPNHVSTLLLGLLAFEDYSLACQNRDDADAAMHRALYESTAQARATMETALEKLLKHEGIVL